MLQCLMLDGRAPMRRIAEAAGVSEQTAARRYRAMREAGALRVFVNESALGTGRALWLLRMQCRPDTSSRLGAALAARPDVAWVAAHSGGSELMCTTTLPADAACGTGVLPRLSNSASLLSFSAYSVLHSYSGGPAEWSGFDQPLSSGPTSLPTGGQAPATVSDEDRPLLEALRTDGRASISQLARELNWPTSRVATHLQALLDSGAVNVDVDVLLERFGFRASATLLLQVAPRHIRKVGEALAGRPWTSWVAAITGPANIAAAVTCRDTDQLFRFVTDDVGRLPGIIHVEILPVLTRLKQADTRVIDGRLEWPAR
ncbi:Lrp/AsnC family transcriptional regulator [Kineosporia rhizophila]|uniref:Lrp/AsnC family transcriptional regulator n=1 Tax=Kineosporia rhizophila TaxID=84633 RepID=UPI002FCD9C8B